MPGISIYHRLSHPFLTLLVEVLLSYQSVFPLFSHSPSTSLYLPYSYPSPFFLHPFLLSPFSTLIFSLSLISSFFPFPLHLLFPLSLPTFSHIFHQFHHHLFTSSLYSCYFLLYSQRLNSSFFFLLLNYLLKVEYTLISSHFFNSSNCYPSHAHCTQYRICTRCRAV